MEIKYVGALQNNILVIIILLLQSYINKQSFAYFKSQQPELFKHIKKREKKEEKVIDI